MAKTRPWYHHPNVGALLLAGIGACAEGRAAESGATKGRGVTLRSVASDGPAMRFARASHSATLLADGSVLVAGGIAREGDVHASAELYDAARDAWRPTGPMGEARVGHTATRLRDGRVLLVGGWGTASPLASAELYDPRTGRFESAGVMGGRRSGHQAVLLPDGRVLVAGGFDGSTCGRTSEIWDARTRAFTPAGSLAAPRCQFAARALDDGTVLMIGGDDRHRVTATVERFVTETETFAPAAAMRAARHKLAAVPLASGLLLVAGGSDERDGRGRLRAAELYDPLTGRWRAADSMSVPRHKLETSSVRLADGGALIVGSDRSVEWYDARGRHVRSEPNVLDAPREFPAAVLLRDGRVLVTGGYVLSPARGPEATPRTWLLAGAGAAARR